MERMYQK